MFSKQRKTPPLPTFIVPRLALVQALARAEYDGNQQASAAARRLLAAIDASPYEYIAV